jgi:1,4-alpha-glucan branching enzyme
MYAQPGKKLLFMGAELGQENEWRHDGSVDWHLSANEPNTGLSRLVTDLNRAYRDNPALHGLDVNPDGFEWIDAGSPEQSVLCFLRKCTNSPPILVVCSFTPVVHNNYRVGVPRRGRWQEIINTDSPHYGGSGQGNLGGVETAPIPYHGRSHSINLTLPPLSVVFLRGPEAR